MRTVLQSYPKPATKYPRNKFIDCNSSNLNLVRNVPTHMTRISDCSTTTSSKLYLSELEHLLSLNHNQNLKNFILHSNLGKKIAFFQAEFFLESLNGTPTRVLCHLRPFAVLFHYTACI